jgi:transcriptional regulator of acetoin/glycerol metabolism
MNNSSHEKLITDSWQRCRNFGLQHETEPEIDQLLASDTRMLLDIHRLLVNTTDHAVLPYYDNILNNSPCLILLADNSGQVLNSWGEKRFLSNTQKQWFRAGTSWREVSTGTNAIGTALTTGQAVQVQRDEHFLKRHRYMIGSASPIYDTNNELLAVLDISSDSYMPQAHTLGMVRLMSQSIENALLFDQYQQHHYIDTINNHADSLDRKWSVLIAIEENGRVSAINRRSRRLFDFDFDGALVDDILGCSIEHLRKQVNVPFEVCVLSKYRMFAKISIPLQLAKLVTSVSGLGGGLVASKTSNLLSLSSLSTPLMASKNKADIDVDLAHIEFGDERIKKAIAQAKKVIEKDIPILVFGETGVGKEVFVKALHHDSERGNKPLVALNCAAIPAELVESELFGYVKGAFTGADTKGSIGLIRKANNGVLFLDEIGDMPLNVQGRLLRVLQERKVTPLGSTQSYPVDVKLISATNCNLKSLVEKERFRRDLFYRVSGLNISLPALRERSDKEKLFAHIVQTKSTSELQSQLPNDIMALFLKHPWPGNIRQFISVLNVALAMADQGAIESYHIPDDFYDDLRLHGSIADSDSLVLDTEKGQRVKFESSELLAFETRDNTEEAMDNKGAVLHKDTLDCFKQYQGNLSKTAKMLGVSRNTLYKRLRELGLK